MYANNDELVRLRYKHVHRNLSTRHVPDGRRMDGPGSHAHTRHPLVTRDGQSDEAVPQEITDLS